MGAEKTFTNVDKFAALPRKLTVKKGIFGN